jgi:hypothetical protein
MVKLLKVVPSTNFTKKYDAYFSDGTKTSFGASGYDDYTITHDRAQRDLYRARHKKDLATDDPTKAGYLSYYILWGDSTSLRTNIASYRRRFNM